MFKLLNSKLAKLAFSLFIFFAPFYKVFFKNLVYVFKAVPAHNPALNFINLNSDRAKEFTFRMSAFLNSELYKVGLA